MGQSDKLSQRLFIDCIKGGDLELAEYIRKARNVQCYPNALVEAALSAPNVSSLHYISTLGPIEPEVKYVIPKLKERVTKQDCENTFEKMLVYAEKFKGGTETDLVALSIKLFPNNTLSAESVGNWLDLCERKNWTQALTLPNFKNYNSKLLTDGVGHQAAFLFGTNKQTDQLFTFGSWASAQSDVRIFRLFCGLPNARPELNVANLLVQGGDFPEEAIKLWEKIDVAQLVAAESKSPHSAYDGRDLLSSILYATCVKPMESAPFFTKYCKHFDLLLDGITYDSIFKGLFEDYFKRSPSDLERHPVFGLLTHTQGPKIWEDYACPFINTSLVRSESPSPLQRLEHDGKVDIAYNLGRMVSPILAMGFCSPSLEYVQPNTKEKFTMGCQSVPTLAVAASPEVVVDVDLA